MVRVNLSLILVYTSVQSNLHNIPHPHTLIYWTALTVIVFMKPEPVRRESCPHCWPRLEASIPVNL